jgi:peptidoglycan hydrolase-like protein with peptidoglycan-binding domain
VAATETPQSSESESGVEASSAKLGGQADPKRGAPLTRQEMVREIQQLLTDLGYTPGPVDGLYGKKTRAAIQAFQVDKNLDPNGQATQQILDALRQSL